MKRSGQSGITLIETAVSAAVLAIGIGGLLFAVNAFARFVTHQPGPARAAALRIADQTLRIAQDAWKYGAPGGTIAGTATVAVPLAIPSASPASIPVQIETTEESSSSSGAQITVTVSFTPDPGRPAEGSSVGTSGTVGIKAPAPGSHLDGPALIPQPSGAP
jgi:hypothetical protein